MSHKNHYKNTKQFEEKDYTDKEILEWYKNKIFHNNFRLYHGFPLNQDDTYKCKVLEKNLNYLKKVVFDNCFKNIGYDINEGFGVGDRTAICHIPEHIPTMKKQQNWPFPLNDDFRKKLMIAPKFKIHQSNKIGYLSGYFKDVAYDSHAHYYAAEIEHKGKKQVVVIKVTINYLNKEGDRILCPYDYSGMNIQALLGKKCKKILTLARLDFNKSKSAHAHQNFLDENQNVIEFGHKNWRKHEVLGTHFHVQTEKFELLNPNCLGSGDAVVVDDANLDFPQLCEKILKEMNFFDLKVQISRDTPITKMYKILNSHYEKENENNEEFNR